MVNRIISAKDSDNKKRMDLAVSRDVRGKWQRIYWPKHKTEKQIKRF